MIPDAVILVLRAKLHQFIKTKNKKTHSKKTYIYSALEHKMCNGIRR